MKEKDHVKENQQQKKKRKKTRGKTLKQRRITKQKRSKAEQKLPDEHHPRMDSNAIEGATPGERKHDEDDESLGNNTATHDSIHRASVESLETTDSAASSASSSTELEETVIEITDWDEQIGDHTEMRIKYKDLIGDKTATFQNCEDVSAVEYKKLLELYNALDEAKQAADRASAEKDKVIVTQKAIIEKCNSEMHHRSVSKRNADNSIKIKTKRRAGSAKSVEINECDYPGCGGKDVDLAMCSSCEKYVCEACNNVPVSKLKAVMKVCDTIHFLCKDCSSDTAFCSPGNASVDHNGDKTKNLREEIIDKMKIIKTLEAGQKALNDLVEDRNVVINSQKTILDNDKIELSDIKEKLIEAKKLNEVKERDVADMKEKIAALESTGNGSQNAIKKLEEELGNAESNKQILMKKLEDQISLTKKAEIAFDTQEKLTLSKCEVIENLKMIISQKEKTPSCLPTQQTQGEQGNLTSNNTHPSGINNAGSEQHGESNKIPGFEESFLCLSGIALHGLVVNGLLLWVDIQRRTVPSNEWKDKALKHFTAEEINNAKNMLWEICDEDLVGKLVRRQGSAKQQAEINDIENALNILSELQMMPLFVASSTMVMQTPHEEISPLAPSSKDLEDMVANAVKKCTGQLEKKYDQSISKSSHGIKKMEDLIKRLEVLERGENKEKFPQRPAAQPCTRNNGPNENQRSVHFSSSTITEDTRESEPDRDTSRLWNPVNPNILNRNAPVTTTPSNNDQSWATVVRNGQQNAVPTDNQQKTSWRQRLHLLQGAAGHIGPGQSSSLSADVDIVAYNIGKNVTAVDLCNWLAQRELHVKDCQLLTTSAEARSLSYKLTIKPEDYDRATQDATIWPYRVGVRLYKSFNKRSENQRYIGDTDRDQHRDESSRSGRRSGYSQRWKVEGYPHHTYKRW